MLPVSLVAATIVALSLAACSEAPRHVLEKGDPASPDREILFSTQQTRLTGYHFHNWEGGHSVLALGLDGPVCLQLADGMRLSQPRNGAVSIADVTGRISERGHYGHMGGCAYVFVVDAVLLDREASPTEIEALGVLSRTVFLQRPDEVQGAASDEIVANPR